MIAYYIHWIYPPSADSELYYGGVDDERLFHHEENAENTAKRELAEPTDEDFGDFPTDYKIIKREIIFEDE